VARESAACDVPSHLYCFSFAPNPRWSRSFMIEAQIRFVTGAVTHARRRGAVQVAVRPEAETAYDRALQEKMRRTVSVTGGCRSWYLNDAGRNVSLWPDFTWAFAWQTRRFDVSSYEVLLPHPQ
jgi:hypothetical protein